MKFYGMIFSMIDFPDELGLTIFTKGCNLRCPICHNPALVTPPESLEAKVVTEDEVMRTVDDKWITGICITGGEPTLHSDLPDTIRLLREKAKIKLDTNGMNPDMLQYLLDEHLLDFVAMDVKAPLDEEKLELVTGRKWPRNPISTSEVVSSPQSISAVLAESIRIIKVAEGLRYHFRTVCFEKFLSPEDIGEIARSIAPCQEYMLSPFDPHATLDPALRHEPKSSYEYMKRCLAEAKKHIPDAHLVGD